MKSREIKFRAWDTVDKKWLFGYEYPNLSGFNLVGEVTLMGELNSVSLERWNSIEIMQYTGLIDKNALEIYEGDIVTNLPGQPVNHNYLVYWNEICAAFYLRSIGQNGESLSVPVKGIIRIDKVIGNVYQSPELLTGTR